METADPTYGSDKDGLVWGYLFIPGEAVQLIDADVAAELLVARSEGASWFLWLHFSLSNAKAERWLRTHLALPEIFHGSLHEPAGSTRIEQDGDSLVVLVHDVLFDFSFNTSDVSSVSLYVEPRVLVSARPRPLRSIDRLRAAVRAGETFRSPAELLAHLLRDQAEVLADIVRRSTTRANTIEDNLLANRIASSRAELGLLRRMLIRLQRLLAPEPGSLFRLLNRPPSWIGKDDIQDLRQSAEEFSTVVADSAALVERLKLLQEELAALINEQNNRSLFVLTIVTVLAVPFNLVAGLFGMNVGGIPLARHGHGFAVIVAVVAITTATVGILAFRRRRIG